MFRILLLIGCTASVPTATPRGEAVAPVPGLLRSGARLVAQVDRELSTGQVKAGDRFVARLVTPVEGLAPETRIAGTVVESHRGDQESEPVLRLKVDRLEPCGKRLAARVSSLELETSSGPAGDSYRSGAIVGTVVGGILWSAPGALTGYGVGLTGGAIHEARQRMWDARLRPGALMQLQLTAPLDLRRACQRPRTSTPDRVPM